MSIELPDRLQPPIKLKDPAAEFIETRLEETNPLFKPTPPNLQYNVHGTQLFSCGKPDSSGSMSPIQPVPFSSTILFENAMELWSSSEPQSPITKADSSRNRKRTNLVDQQRFSIRGKRSWLEVEEVFKEARDIFFDATNTQAIHRRFWNTCISDDASLQDMKSWIQLVPSSGMTALLVGGVTMIIDGAIRLNMIKKDIGKAIEELPLQLKSIETATDLFPNEVDVRKAATELLAAIFDGLENTIMFYLASSKNSNSKPGSRFRSVLSGVGGGPESKTKNQNRIAYCIDNVRTKAANLLHYLEMAHIKKSNAIMLISESIQQETRAGNEANAVVQNTALIHLRDLLVRAEWQAESLKQIHRDFSNLRKDYNSLKEYNPTCKQSRVGSWQSTKERLTISGSSKNKLCSEADQLVLTTYIQQHNHNLAALADIEDNVHSGPTLPTSEQNRLVWLTKSEPLRDWVTSPYTEPLLVRGNTELTSKIVATSVMSALLAQVLRQSNSGSAYVLSFFCGMHGGGRHGDQNDVFGGPLALIVSLLDQLIRQAAAAHFGFDFSILRRSMAKKARRGSIRHLAQLLVTLISQLPSQAVLFVLIDGICYYEDLGDTAIIMNELIGIASNPEEKGCKCLFKILVTSPTRTAQLHRAFLKPNILDTPQNIEKGDALVSAENTPFMNDLQGCQGMVRIQ